MLVTHNSSITKVSANHDKTHSMSSFLARADPGRRAPGSARAGPPRGEARGPQAGDSLSRLSGRIPVSVQTPLLLLEPRPCDPAA